MPKNNKQQTQCAVSQQVYHFLQMWGGGVWVEKCHQQSSCQCDSGPGRYICWNDRPQIRSLPIFLRNSLSDKDLAYFNPFPWSSSTFTYIHYRLATGSVKTHFIAWFKFLFFDLRSLGLVGCLSFLLPILANILALSTDPFKEHLSQWKIQSYLMQINMKWNVPLG